MKVDEAVLMKDVNHPNEPWHIDHNYKKSYDEMLLNNLPQYETTIKAIHYSDGTCWVNLADHQTTIDIDTEKLQVRKN